MAYIDQDTKKKINLALKSVIPKSWKWTLSVNHHSTLVLTISSAPIDLIADFVQRHVSKPTYGEGGYRPYDTKPTSVNVNHYWLDEQFASPSLTAMFKKILATIQKAGDWYDKSDTQIDYFNTAFYIDLNIGRWDRPFQVK